MNKQQLIDHFRRQYNTVVDAKIIVDQSTKMSKGYGFIQFSNYEESKRALTEMQGSLIKGKPIKVSQGVSRNTGAQGTSNSKHNSGNSMNASLFGQAYGKSGRCKFIQVAQKRIYLADLAFSLRLQKAFLNP